MRIDEEVLDRFDAAVHEDRSRTRVVEEFMIDFANSHDLWTGKTRPAMPNVRHNHDEALQKQRYAETMQEG